MEKQIGNNNNKETVNLCDANMYDVLAQRGKNGESLSIYMGEDGALYSDNGQYLWRVVDRKKFNVPDGVVVICDRAFFKCHSLRRISLPKSLRVIGNEVFWQCYELQSVKLPQNLEVIGGYAFNNCKSIETIHIPSSVTEIGGSAFTFCKALTRANIPDGITVIRDFHSIGVLP